MRIDGDVEVMLDIEHAGAYGGRDEPEDQQSGDGGICEGHCGIRVVVACGFVVPVDGRMPRALSA